MWWEWEGGGEETAREETPVDFDFISLLAKPKDYYKILEVDYDASEETIRSSYVRLALKWHPDKKQGEENATSRFQEIDEAYQGLPESAQRFNTHLQWTCHQVLGMVNMLRGATVCIHLPDTILFMLYVLHP